MYVVPSGMLLGAPVSVSQALLWNLLPVTLGNVVAGVLFTGMAVYATYAARPVPAARSAKLPADAPVPTEQTAALAGGGSLHPM